MRVEEAGRAHEQVVAEAQEERDCHQKAEVLQTCGQFQQASHPRPFLVLGVVEDPDWRRWTMRVLVTEVSVCHLRIFQHLRVGVEL